MKTKRLDSSGKSILTPGLVRTSSQHVPLSTRTPDLKPSSGPDLRVAGLQETPRSQSKVYNGFSNEIIKLKKSEDTNKILSFSLKTMCDKENYDFNRDDAESPSCTPAKPRLGKFVDVYSPQHLNLTPNNKQKLDFGLRDESPDLYTPDKNSERRDDFKCRTVKPEARYRHVLGNCSFEGNQSFPRLSRRVRPIKMELETPTKVKPPSDFVRVDGPNGLRFNTSLAAGDRAGSPAQSQTDRLQQTINPSKAVFTIEPNSFKILIVNNKACSLLGYSSGELCDLQFSDLLHSRSSHAFKLHEPEDADSSENRPMVLLSGKVVELVTKDGGTVQVSLWIRQLDNEGPCLVVAEPVTCKNVKMLVEGETGVIVSCTGEDASLLFQADSTEQLVGLPLSRLVPSIRLPAAADPPRVYKQKATGRTLDGASFPLCLWISKADSPDDSSWTSAKYKDKSILEVNIRVTCNVSGLLVVDEAGLVAACNPHFAALTFGQPPAAVLGQPVRRLLPAFCRPADLLQPAPSATGARARARAGPRPPRDSDTDDDSCGAFNGSQKSLNVQPSLLSATREKSSSALCLDKSASLVTHTPTPTQDMVSSISTTEQRHDLSALPDLTSGMSGISIDDDNYCPSLSKSRSENILRSEHAVPGKLAKGTEKSDSIYYTSQHSQEVTPTGGAPRVRINDPSLRLSFDSSKYKSLKANLPGQVIKDDKSSLSLDFCDSNETSADFLTPINEMPPPGCELEELPHHNGTEASDTFYNDDLDTHTESVPKKKYEDDTATGGSRGPRALLSTSTPRATRDCVCPCPCPPRDCSCAPRDCSCAHDCGHRDGTYRGTLLHHDGTELNVIYTVSTMVLSTGSRVRYVWLGVQLEDNARHTTLASSQASTADDSLALPLPLPLGNNKSGSSRPQSISLASQCGDEQTAGDYSKHYVTLKQIGKGAYGCVKMAYRRSDRLLAVAKFILKEKVGPAFWVDGPSGRRLPLELSLLLTLQHPHIVSVLDAFENDKYFQMVMQKHGAGMDLFEFIERRPRLDEPLISHIFRQIGQAVEYLHSLNILHRDIKDENVIIDNRFHVKLIDFGSATFMSRDALFSTFYGTTEYCSPEVLAGNKYAGPELEMWSMGITLYVLTFFVNPFSDIEDTIQGPLHFPQPVSEDLEQLLRWMLCKEPARRCTVPQLMGHPWVRQPVRLDHYVFHHVVDCDRHEASPELYYSGSAESPRSPRSPRTPSPASLAEHNTKGRGPGGGGSGRGAAGSRRAPDASDNYSSVDLLEASSKPVSEAGLTDISSDATGHAACDIACDCGRDHPADLSCLPDPGLDPDPDPDLYAADSWDECEQDSFS
ncbi:hypothetical protein evm_011419 [Chilo suppressalis]|nr:hypothetical protein evm_011419 [Chilo suppressalis]